MEVQCNGAAQAGISPAGEQLCGKVLGVLVDKQLNRSERCAAAVVKEANRMHHQCFVPSRDKEGIVPIYSALVRPYLEYWAQF